MSFLAFAAPKIITAPIFHSWRCKTVKKVAAFVLSLILVLTASGCSSVKFSTPTAYEDLSGSSEVTVSIKDQSLTDTGLILLIQNHTEMCIRDRERGYHHRGIGKPQGTERDGL